MLALAFGGAFGQAFIGKWVGKIVIEPKATDARSLRAVRPYQAAAQRTTLTLVLNADKTFNAVVFNANGKTMSMSGQWVTPKSKDKSGPDLQLVATEANGVKQKTPGVIDVTIGKDGKTLTASMEDALKVTKWVYTREAKKKNGK